MEAKLLLKYNAKLGEGAIWNQVSNELYWVDIDGCTFNIYNPLTFKNKVYHTQSNPGTAVPAGDNRVLLALKDGLAYLNTLSGNISYIKNSQLNLSNKRFNDGKCDPLGRFWVGTLSLGNVSAENKLYCYDADEGLKEKLGSLSISNGVAWSNDCAFMYHIDTPTREVTRYDFDATGGEISNGSVVFRFDKKDGYPDGMTIDNEGMLWIALWDGFAVAKVNPFTGELLEKIHVPVPKVTSCAFGGPELNKLYITTARVEMTEDELKDHPLSGSLFVCHGVSKGVPSFGFASGN